MASVNINNVTEALNINYNSEEWRLFTDSSSVSLKAVLLRNANELPSIPIGRAVHTKESYEDTKILLEPMRYLHFVLT
jgi:hypothetical protein